MKEPQSQSIRAEKKAIEWLTMLRSSSLTAQQKQQFFSWLESSAENQRAFIQVEQLWQRGTALSQAQTDNNSSKPRNILRPINLWYSLGFATTCILSLFLFFSTANKANNTLFQTGVYERREISLSDGTVLNLNVDSKIIVDFSKDDAREVVINRGEVFFNVAHNPKRPFKIKDQNSEIKVIGTQFSVRSTSHQTRVIVVNGKVQLTTAESSKVKTQQTKFLGSNQQADIGAETMKVTTVNAAELLAWQSGMLRFNGSTLSDVVKELNRYYPEKIEIGDKTLENLRVVAVLPLHQDLKTNLNHLGSNLNVISVKDPASKVIRLLSAGTM